MKYARSTATGTAEFLASEEFLAVPITMTVNAAAGTPVTAAGAKDLTGANACGILLYDVNISENPVGAAMVHGIVMADKMISISSNTTAKATLISNLKSAVPGIICR